ncbi:hypothetical protein [Streptomyces sp. NPDC059819]|uniref:hypothetical protein n=1 Tax=Streptomyces sp. NPDC059819 TaxID=3346963 RepID=UPI00365334AC
MIDVQNGFVNEHSRHVVPVIGRLSEQWEAAGAPVLFSRYFNHPGSDEPHPAGRLRANRPLPQAPTTTRRLQGHLGQLDLPL